MNSVPSALCGHCSNRTKKDHDADGSEVKIGMRAAARN